MREETVLHVLLSRIRRKAEPTVWEVWGFEDAEGYILCRGGLLGRYLILDGRNTPSTSQIWTKS